MLLIDIFSDPRNLLCWFCDKKPLILRALRTITSAPAQLWIISQNMTHNTISQKQNIPPPNWFPEEIEIQVGLPPRRWAIFLPISWLDLRFVMTQCSDVVGPGNLSISPGQLQIITALYYTMTDTDINMNTPVASLLRILGWWWWLECFTGPCLSSPTISWQTVVDGLLWECWFCC